MLPRPLSPLALALVLVSAAPLAAGPPAGAQQPPPSSGTAPQGVTQEVKKRAAPPAPPPGETVLEEESPVPLEEGATVVRGIEVRSDAPVDVTREDLHDLVAIALDRPLTRDEVRRTLRNIQASGIASRVAVYTRPAPGGGGGVVVTVAFWTNVIVDHVRVDGDFGKVDKSDLSNALVQGEGQPLLEDRVLRGVYRLQDLLEERGYRGASVRLEVKPAEAEKRVDVIYHVEAGARSLIGKVLFDGEIAPFTPEQLVAEIRSRPGEPYRQRTVRDDAERLQHWLVEQGYRKASVKRAREDFRPEEKRVDLTFPVELGPRVEVTIVGADRRRLEKKGLLPFLGDEGYDEALVLQAVDKIKAWLQGEGHYEAQVDWHEETKDGVLRLALKVSKGPLYTLEAVRFQGNREVSSSQLAGLMQTTPKSLLKLGSGHLVDEVLAADLSNIRSYYALHGFTGYKVGPEQVQRKDHSLILTIPIEEGTRRQVESIRFEGTESLGAGSLLRQLPLEQQGPYSPVLLEDSLDAIRAAYEAHGFTQARVSSRLHWNADGDRVEVTFQILEGPQELLGRVLVRGNRRTEGDVIRRAVGIRPGQPISGTRLLEVERNLYALGIFSRVDVELVPADLGAKTRDIVVRVEEGKTKRITYGLGYDSQDGARGTLGFSNNNVLGRGFTFGLDTRLSQRDQRFRMSFKQPWVRGWPLAMTYQVFRFEEDRESFKPVRWVARLEGVDTRGSLQLGLSYDYRLVENPASVFRDALRVPGVGEDGTPTLGPVQPGILSPFEQGGQVQVSSLIPNLFIDRRDDPLSPTRGWSSTVQLQYAFPFLGAKPEFLKLFLQQSDYVDLGRVGILATSLRIGGIEPLRSIDGRSDPLTIPIDERFFAGGQSTHRAYGRFQLGIPGETLKDGFLPIGGDGLLLLNTEVRFPIVGPLGGTVFFDSGNVWSDWRDISVGGLKSGAGVGIRYLSPIGPLRLDVGWKFERAEVPGSEGQPPLREPGVEIFLSFGNPF